MSSGQCILCVCRLFHHSIATNIHVEHMVCVNVYVSCKCDVCSVQYVSLCVWCVCVCISQLDISVFYKKQQLLFI